MSSTFRKVFALGATASFVAGLAGFGLVGTTASCASSPDTERFTAVIQPDYDAYRLHVDKYINRRCGTLDCHGQAGRAYRVYGREGFRVRLPDGGGNLTSGGQSSTPEETLANFQAIVGLEPEEMSRTMALVNNPDLQEAEGLKRLIFIRKPLRLERHKGGPSMAEDDPGYRCVRAWLAIPVVRPDGSFIPPAERPKLSPLAQAYCKQAEDMP